MRKVLAIRSGFGAGGLTQLSNCSALRNRGACVSLSSCCRARRSSFSKSNCVFMVWQFILFLLCQFSDFVMRQGAADPSCPCLTTSRTTPKDLQPSVETERHVVIPRLHLPIFRDVRSAVRGRHAHAHRS